MKADANILKINIFKIAAFKAAVSALILLAFWATIMLGENKSYGIIAALMVASLSSALLSDSWILVVGVTGLVLGVGSMVKFNIPDIPTYSFLYFTVLGFTGAFIVSFFIADKWSKLILNRIPLCLMR